MDSSCMFQSKFQCAIQQYKQALLVNDSNISVLYYISRQYYKLDRTAAELETLGLLESVSKRVVV